MRMTWVLGLERGEEAPTLYAVLVRGLDLCQDHFRREWTEDGQPEDDFDGG